MALVKAGEKFEGFHYAKFVWQGSGLQGCADFVFKLSGVFLWIETADGDAAAVWGAQALENFYRAGFAGAVGAQQSEDFAFFHVKANAAHRLYGAVVLDEILYLQDGIWHV